MQEEIREFYVQFACQMGGGIPAYLANTPDVTSEITLETAHELLATGHFAGIEDPGRQCRVLRLPSGRLPFRRRSQTWWNRAARGAHGVLSSAACAVPELVVALDAALHNGNQDHAAHLGSMLNEFLSWGGPFPFPVLVKVAAGLRGIQTGCTVGAALARAAAQTGRLP